ncbi:SHQ1 protein-domain-containing protein [Hygrophoropsis aurantiaca]|uniref:SHQ1 protein-domain-containing protein n=1 Tax=Hygrophoropsis aurantiaca TaxID=72124 RepID=A0ACB8AG58_9AGAM|nr:SHQ1 protein-domain-containing protein [Hygrophoropsis aurantiaca]
MITPRFSCTQNEGSVIVIMYCPSVRAADVEINVDETLLSVHINPYFLRLNFSHPVLEDDNSSAKYDPSSGYLIVTLTKELKGQEFKDLDLLAKLLAPRSAAPTNAPTIEVIETQNTSEDETEELVRQTKDLSIEQSLSTEQKEILEAAENDWQLPQSVPEPLSSLHLSSKKHYGFLNMYTGYFTHVAHIENEVNELGADTETCTPEDRRIKRCKHENEKWDEEHYMADFADDEYIQELLHWKDPDTADDADHTFTEDENMTMLNLPRKEYIATSKEHRNLHLTLLTVLFAYAYDRRTTLNDPTSESPWTICSLIPAFSALDPPPYSPSDGTVVKSLVPDDIELASTMIQSYRRSFVFPLYRSFALAETCRKDVAALLARGKRSVVRWLLGLKRILDHHEVYYIYSKIWLDDYCVWAQTSLSDETLHELSQCLKDLTITKDMIGWDLEDLENATSAVLDRTTDSDDEDSDSD